MNPRHDPESGLTLDEREVSDLLVMAWSLWIHNFAAHGLATESEKQQFKEGMHMMQAVFADRALGRAYPNYWR